MSRSSLRLTVGMLALVVGAALLVALVGGASSNSNTGVARFRETEVTHSMLGDYAGGTETWRTRIYLLHRQQLVGTGVIACVRADDKTSIRECQGTAILPQGRIQLAGEIITPAAYQLVIVGGSGIYANARGIAVFIGPRQNRLIVFYLS